MFFQTPQYSVAMNAKCGSSSFARAIVTAFHPKSLERVMLEGGERFMRWHKYCPKEKQPSNPVILVVRSPVERFASAVAQFSRYLSVEAALDSLENGDPLSDNFHFWHQHALLCGGTAFPMSRIDDAAEMAGIPVPLPKLGAARRPKPELTREQQVRVENYYAADVALFESVR